MEEETTHWVGFVFLPNSSDSILSMVLIFKKMKMGMSGLNVGHLKNAKNLHFLDDIKS